MRRPLRILGTVLTVAGALTLVWALVVWQWQDPFTALYTRYEQHNYSCKCNRQSANYNNRCKLHNTSCCQPSFSMHRHGYRHCSGDGQYSNGRCHFHSKRCRWDFHNLHISCRNNCWNRNLH